MQNEVEKWVSLWQAPSRFVCIVQSLAAGRHVMEYLESGRTAPLHSLRNALGCKG